MYQKVAHDLRDKWTKEQEEYVRQNYDGEGSKLSNVLPFSANAIRNKAKRLGVINNQHFHHVIKTELPKISIENLQYSAGFIDGEGSFYPNSRKTIQYKCSVANSNIEVIKWLLNIFVIGKIRVYQPRGNQHLPSYVWVIERQGDLWGFTELIWPYLKVKQQDAKSIFDYLEIRHRVKTLIKTGG